ncbi:hypothetical protein D9M70_548440 [compost metagenome]
MVGVVDAVPPALQGMFVNLRRLQRIAEHAKGRHGDVAVADRRHATFAKFGKILAVRRLPEEGLETLKAHVGNLADAPVGAALCGRDHRADADGFAGVLQDWLPRLQW